MHIIDDADDLGHVLPNSLIEIRRPTAISPPHKARASERDTTARGGPTAIRPARRRSRQRRRCEAWRNTRRRRIECRSSAPPQRSCWLKRVADDGRWSTARERTRRRDACRRHAGHRSHARDKSVEERATLLD
jgi:hypothetical protein